MIKAVLEFVATTYVNAISKGFKSLASARQARDADEKNRHVSDAAQSLATTGFTTLVIVVAILFVMSVKTGPFPPIILCVVIFFTGSIALIMGQFLQTVHNSGDYITVAGITMWAATIGAIIALGIAIAGVLIP